MAWDGHASFQIHIKKACMLHPQFFITDHIVAHTTWFGTEVKYI